jgi:hypothetical protein
VIHIGNEPVDLLGRVATFKGNLYNAYLPVDSSRHECAIMMSMDVSVALTSRSLTQSFLDLAHISSLTISASRRLFARHCFLSVSLHYFCIASS